MTLAFVGQQLRDTSIHTTYEALLYAGSSGLSLSSLRVRNLLVDRTLFRLCWFF